MQDVKNPFTLFDLIVCLMFFSALSLCILIYVSHLQLSMGQGCTIIAQIQMARELVLQIHACQILRRHF